MLERKSRKAKPIQLQRRHSRLRRVDEQQQPMLVRYILGHRHPIWFSLATWRLVRKKIDTKPRGELASSTYVAVIKIINGCMQVAQFHHMSCL